MKRREFLGTVAAGMAAAGLPAVAWATKSPITEDIRERWWDAVQWALDYRNRKDFYPGAVVLLKTHDDALRRGVEMHLACAYRHGAYRRLRDSICVSSRIEDDVLVTEFTSDAGRVTNYTQRLSVIARRTTPDGFVVRRTARDRRRDPPDPRFLLKCSQGYNP